MCFYSARFGQWRCLVVSRHNDGRSRRIPLNTHVTDSTATRATQLRDLILRKLTYTLGKPPSEARDRDWYMATALAVRDHVVDNVLAQMRAPQDPGGKTVYYLSLEFLVGRLLGRMSPISG